MERYDKAFDQQVTDLVADIEKSMDYDDAKVKALAWDSLGLGDEHRKQKKLEKKLNEMRCMTTDEERGLREKLAKIESKKTADIQQMRDELQRIQELKGEYDGSLCRNYRSSSHYNVSTDKQTQTHFNDAKQAAKESLYPEFKTIEELKRMAKQAKRDLTFCDAQPEVAAVWEAFASATKKLVTQLQKK